MYTIRYDRKLDLLDITWSGLMTPDDIKNYAEECRACSKSERLRDGYKLRIVLSDVQALPQDTLVALNGAFDGFPRSGRSAMVTGSAIARLQIKRAMMAHHEIFDTPAAALDFLLAP